MTQQGAVYLCACACVLYSDMEKHSSVLFIPESSFTNETVEVKYKKLDDYYIRELTLLPVQKKRKKQS